MELQIKASLIIYTCPSTDEIYILESQELHFGGKR